MDAYLVLGVTRTSSQAAIKAAWRHKARIHHPDCCTIPTEEMTLINAAYDCLKTPQRRACYDAQHGLETAATCLEQVWERFDAMFEDMFGPRR